MPLGGDRGVGQKSMQEHLSGISRSASVPRGVERVNGMLRPMAPQSFS